MFDTLLLSKYIEVYMLYDHRVCSISRYIEISRMDEVAAKIEDDIKSSWLTHSQRYTPHDVGQKRRLFATPFYS